MLTHLWDTYGSITHADIMANNTTLTTNDWRPPMPMEGLFTKITRCVNYAAAGGAPISAVMAVQAAYSNIEVTGLFTNDCKVWQNKPVAETQMLSKTNSSPMRIRNVRESLPQPLVIMEQIRPRSLLLLSSLDFKPR